MRLPTPSPLLTTQPHSRSHHPNPPGNHLHPPAFPLPLLPHPTHLHLSTRLGCLLFPPTYSPPPASRHHLHRPRARTSNSRHACYTADLAVSEAAQGRGAGRELLERVKHESGPEVGAVVLLGSAAGGGRGVYARVRMARARSSVRVRAEIG